MNASKEKYKDAFTISLSELLKQMIMKANQ